MTGTFFQRARPSDDATLRRAVYGGQVFLLPATAESLALVDLAGERRANHFDAAPRKAHETFDDAELFSRAGRLRKEMYLSEEARHLAAEVAAQVGFPRAESAIDPARARLVVHGASDNPRAAPVYYPHRDTWYGHPMAMVTMWTPLDDLEAHETFVFYPQHFRTAVENDSERFDYDAWTAQGPDLKIGWQDRNASRKAHYPGVLGKGDYGPAEGFACNRGEILLFSGAHFHRTIPQVRGLTRFSLDARVVHLGDNAAGLGAPNVDSRARGSALRDYVMPASLADA